MSSDDYESGFDDSNDDVTDDHHGSDGFFPSHSVSASQLKTADFVNIAGETKEQRKIRFVAESRTRVLSIGCPMLYL